MIIGGCKSKTGDTEAVSDVNITINSADYGDIGDVLRINPRSVKAQDAEAALKAAGLWESSARISWDERLGSGGQYSFKNVKITAENGRSVTANTVNLGGLHMDGGVAKADLVDMSKLKINNNTASLKIDHLGLTYLPLAQNLGAIEKIDDLLDFSRAQPAGDESESRDDVHLGGPQAAVFKGVSGTADQAVFEIDTLGWGQDPKDLHIRFAAEDVLIRSSADDAMSLSLKSAKMRGLNPIDIKPDTQDSRGPLELFINNPQMGDVIIKDFNLTSDIITIDLPIVEQSTDQKGNTTLINSNMPALSLKFGQGDNIPADMLPFFEIINSLGFEKFIFSSQSAAEMNKETDMLTLEGASFNLKDGFDLNYKGQFSGFKYIQDLNNESGPDAYQALQENFKLHGFTMSLEDKSIIERGFNLAGLLMEQSPKDLRRQANGLLAIGSLAALTQKDGAIYSELTRNFSRFLQDGGIMTVQLAPQEPITLKELEALQGGEKPDLKRLGVSSAVKQ